MITKLSESTDEQKQNYLTYYKEVMLTGKAGFKFMEADKEFNDYGLRFSHEYLKKLDKNIIFLPLEIMAEYVDFITKTNIDNNDKEFIYYQIHDFDFDVDKMFDSINATAIGNAAYIIMFCKDEKAREICEKQLNSIYVKQKGRVLNAINESI